MKTLFNIDEVKPYQKAYFDQKGMSDFEITRPHGTGRLYEFLVDYKMRTMAQLVDESLDAAKVLNICCGSGMEAQYFANYGARVTGVDISLGAAKGAKIRSRRFGFELRALVADAESLPFKPESFDFVFTHDGIHHLLHPERGIAEMARVAKRVIFFTEPADAFITRLAVKLGFSANYEESGNLVQRLKVSQLKALFDQLGLSSSQFSRYGMWYSHYPPKWFFLFENRVLFHLLRLFFHVGNAMFGRFGNKLVAVAWKDKQRRKKDESWNKDCSLGS